MEAAGSAAQWPGRSFVLYVEGPRDREVLRGWAARLLPHHAGPLMRSSVILGGRRPARALQHFRGLGGDEAGIRGICVLDRDDLEGPEQPPPEPGLEFFTWSRRHIESYLLVPSAIRRSARARAGDRRLERALREILPDEGDEAAYRAVNAKKLLGPSGALTRALGRPLSLNTIASATRASELHDDVHDLFARIRGAVPPPGQPETP